MLGYDSQSREVGQQEGVGFVMFQKINLKNTKFWWQQQLIKNQFIYKTWIFWNIEIQFYTKTFSCKIMLEKLL